MTMTDKDNGSEMLPGQFAMTQAGDIVQEDPDAAKVAAQHAAEIGKIDSEILSIMASGTKRWVDLYRLIERVEAEELYTPAYHSLTAWARALSERGRFQLRELWRCRKAGRFYAEYAARLAAQGKAAPRLEDIDTKAGASISPRNFERVEKIAAGDSQKADTLVGKMLAGKVTAHELEQLWRTEKAAGAHVRTSRHDTAQAADDTAESPEKPAMTAADIVLALQTCDPSAWLPEQHKDTRYMQDPDKYRVFSEFPVHTGTSDHARRMDALIVETYGAEALDEVVLQAIEIKVSVYDLEGDTKMQEYADFADYLWLVVPDVPEMVAAAQAHVSELQGQQVWGILAVLPEGMGTSTPAEEKPESGRLRVIQKPQRLPGIMRDKSLATLVHKLI